MKDKQLTELIKSLKSIGGAEDMIMIYLSKYKVKSNVDLKTLSERMSVFFGMVVD